MLLVAVFESKLPREFWKVIVFVEEGKLKAKGFMLTQNLDELEALELEEFKVYQVALTEIEARCGFHSHKTSRMRTQWVKV